MSFNIILIETGDVSIIGDTCGFIEDKDYVYISGFIDVATECFDTVMFSSTTFLVALHHDDKVIGGCGLSITNGLHIDALCVKPSYQNQGIGTRILNKAMEIGITLDTKKPDWIDLVIPYGNGVFPMSDKKQLTLEIDRYAKDYHKLVSFYTKNGYEVSSVPGMCEAYCRKTIKCQHKISL